MKTILKIILILLVASVVAGAFSLAVNNNATTPGPSDGGQPPALTGSNGQVPTRPEGSDDDDGSLAGGAAGMLSTLLKLTGITILVLLLQKGFRQFGKLKWKPAQQQTRSKS